MIEKSLSTEPAGEGYMIVKPGKTCRIWFCFTSVEFERRYGYFHRPNSDLLVKDWPIKETKKYNNVSKSSLNRLHKVVSSWVNEAQATINLFQMRDGAGYEVEI